MGTSKNGYAGNTISDTPRICIVGAGFGGLLAAIQLKRRLGNTNFTVLDKNNDFGGVWLTSKYPGSSADLPGYMYCYSFEINYGSSKLYPDRSELHQYFRRVALKYKIYDHARFGTTVSAMTWTGRKWIVTSSTATADIDCPKVLEEEYDMVIMATGPFHGINYPEMFKSFNGPIMHSAQWDNNIPLENKVVGVVGSSATGVQVVPAIEPIVKELICYQRSAPYGIMKGQMSMPSWLNFLFRWVPGLVWIFLAVIWFFIEIGAFLATSSLSWVTSFAGWLCVLWMKLHVKDPKLRKGLTPDYRFGARFPIITDTFFKAMTRKHVRLETGTIQKIEGDEIITEDGRRQKLDVLILCTGYKVQDYFAPIKVTGRRGQDLLQLWKKGTPISYYGTTCSAAPNLFILLGPNTVLFGGFVPAMECQMNIVINVMKHMQKINAVVFNVTEEAEQDCFREIQQRQKTTAWYGKAQDGTWVFNEHGEQTVFWPGTATAFWWKTRKFDPKKFEFQKKFEDV